MEERDMDRDLGTPARALVAASRAALHVPIGKYLRTVIAGRPHVLRALVCGEQNR